MFQYDASPPTQNQFNPPEPDDIRTIYVPYDNAANVPDVFDVSVGSSFGYSEPAPEPVKPATPPSSYDNPISSFDAPIYDENSYTAAAVSSLFRNKRFMLFGEMTPREMLQNLP